MLINSGLDERLAARALAAFHDVITGHTSDFPPMNPLAIAGANAAVTGQWVIEFAASVLPPAFNESGLCSPRSRCLGCQRICMKQNSAYYLSLQAGGMPALSIAAIEYPSTISTVVISSFVPGRQDLGDRWFPAAFERHPFVLIAQDGSKAGIPTAAGNINILANLPGSSVSGMVLFNRRWRASIAQLVAQSEGAQ